MKAIQLISTTLMSGLLSGIVYQVPSQAATFSINSGGGTNDSFASGTITDLVNGVQTVVANFSLTQSVKTGYGNHNYFDGSTGIGVDHLRIFGAADDNFSYELTVTPLLPEISQTSIIVLGANPYQARNYGPDLSQGQDNTITATWAGGALGTISNPNENIGLTDGSTVVSGFTTSWNTGDRIPGDWSFNQADWDLTVPVDSLIYSFSSTGETFAEGVAFDVQFQLTSASVPESSPSLVLLGLGILGLGMRFKAHSKLQPK